MEDSVEAEKASTHKRGVMGLRKEDKQAAQTNPLEWEGIKK